MIDDIWFKPYDFQNIAFENIDAVRLSGSRIFYSFIIEGKKEFLKMSCFMQSISCLVKGLGNWLLLILHKKQRFFYTSVFVEDI